MLLETGCCGPARPNIPHPDHISQAGLRIPSMRLPLVRRSTWAADAKGIMRCEASWVSSMHALLGREGRCRRRVRLVLLQVLPLPFLALSLLQSLLLTLLLVRLLVSVGALLLVLLVLEGWSISRMVPGSGL